MFPAPLLTQRGLLVTLYVTSIGGVCVSCVSCVTLARVSCVSSHTIFRHQCVTLCVCSCLSHTRLEKFTKVTHGSEKTGGKLRRSRNAKYKSVEYFALGGFAIVLRQSYKTGSEDVTCVS